MFLHSVASHAISLALKGQSLLRSIDPMSMVGLLLFSTVFATLACSLVWDTLRPSSPVQFLSPPPDCMSHIFSCVVYLFLWF